MKRIIFTILTSLFLGTLCHAQSNYDLEFEFDFVKDTVRIGETVNLTGFVANNGPDAFDGDIRFNLKSFAPSEVIDFSKLTDADTFFTLPAMHFKINALGKANITLPVTITKDFWADSTNIVIVWPDETFTDENNSNNYGQFSAFVLKDTTLKSGVHISAKEETRFNIYPNPAKNNVKISFEGVRKGQIWLTDITGKIMHTENIAAGTQSIFWPLDICGNSLPNGLYFISLQTENQRITKKLQIIH